MPPPDPTLSTARAVARELRRRVTAIVRKLPRRRRHDLMRLVLAEVRKAEPLLAGAVRDGQVLAFIDAARDHVERAEREAQEAREQLAGQQGAIPAIPATPTPTPGPLASTPARPSAPSSSVPARVPARPLTPISLFPPTPGVAPPAAAAVRLPMIEHATHFLRTRLDFTPAEAAALGESAGRVGFTVAKAATLDAVERVRQAVIEDVRDGGTLRQFRAKVRQAIDASTLADHQVETLYRTHVGRAYAAGQLEVLDTPLVGDEFPYVEYSATHDARVRPEHLAMESLGLNGTAIYRADDPVIRMFWPPWSFNCVLPGTKVEGEFVAGVRSRYRGKAVEIVTRGGSVLRVTENHPVLTEHGWVKAGTIQKGNQLIRNMTRREVIPDGATSVESNRRATQVDHKPAPIEQVFHSLTPAAGAKLRRAVGRDFDGDGQFFKSQVQIVTPNGSLLVNREPVRSKHGRNVVLEVPFSREVSRPHLPGSGSITHPTPFESLRFGLTAALDARLREPFGEYTSAVAALRAEREERFSGGVASRDFGKVIDSGFAAHPLDERERLAIGAEFYTGATKHPSKAGFADAEFAGERKNGRSLLVPPDHGGKVGYCQAVGQKNGLPDRPGFHPAKGEVPLENAPARADFGREFVQRLAGAVAFDEVVQVRHFEWSGHVYDLQSTTGLIIADNLLIGNCRCIVIPLSIEDAARKGVREAQEWVRTGRPPARPEYVAVPPFSLPKGWVPITSRLEPVLGA